MKASTSAILLAMLLGTAAAAQEQTPSRTTTASAPDYSRESLMRIFVVDQQEEKRRSIEFHPGWIDFRLLGTRVRFSPFFAPLSGSEHLTNREWPDPFSLTGAEIAQTPATFRRTRETNAELRALERRVRATSKVKVAN